MEALGITNIQIISFLLTFFRTGAILFTAPFFSSKNINTRVRILLSLTIAIVLTTSFTNLMTEGIGDVSRFMRYPALIMAIFREVALGIAIGFTAQLTFAGIQLAGQIVGHEMGFGLTRLLDPSMNTNVTITAQYNVVLATMIFLLIRGHHHILMGMARSFSEIPLGGWNPSASFTGHLNDTFSGIFKTAFRLAIPVMAVLFLTKIGMAIIARTIPQMNVFIVGFPLQISIGLIAMALSLPFFVKTLNGLFELMRNNIWLIASGDI